jgi:hypothetical protein
MINCIDDVRHEILPLLDRFPALWCVAGGWAIDLFLGKVSRSHADIELAVFRQDQLLLHRYLKEWRFEKIIDGRRAVWAEGERLELPVHEIHARRVCGSPASVEFLLNERDADDWVYRRDASRRLPIERAILHASVGLPVLAPEIVLLFKSKSPREKDVADFATLSLALSRMQRQWLMQAVAATDPTHPWLAPLAAAVGDA